MTNYRSILSSALGQIKPSPETRGRVASLAARLVGEVQEVADAVAQGSKVEIHGSVAKGTYLEGRHDIDVFVFYPEDASREQLERNTLRIGREWARRRGVEYSIAYAEHPYVKAFVEEDGRPLEVDIVGAYLIESTVDLLSAVDRTRFHTGYVRERVGPRIRDQILLTKQFMKGTGVYGSEVRIGGFSGLLCEILTIHAGGFLNLLRSARCWKVGEVIDPEGKNPSASDRFQAPLVVVDPTDGNRNAAAAVSKDRMARFVHAADAFLREPSEAFFFPRRREPPSAGDLAELARARGTRLTVLSFEKPEVVDDIVYPQVERMINSLRGQLEEHGFSIEGPSSGNVCEEGGRIWILFEIGVHNLPLVERRLGPTVERTEHARRFLQKHAGASPYLEGDRWCVDVERRYPDAEGLLRHILDNNPHGILPKHLARAIAGGYRLASNRDAFRSGPDVRLMLVEHLLPRFPWENP